MTTETAGPSSSHSDSVAAQRSAELPVKRWRWTRRFSDRTQRLTHSEHASLTWRIIAGKSKPGEAHGLLRAWTGWEYLAQRLWPAIELTGSRHRLLSIRAMRYQGEVVQLPDGTTVQPGAMVGELHCNNRAVLQLVRGHGNPFAAGREDLRSLSSWAQRDALGREIDAFYASTILAKGARRFGFSVHHKPITLRGRFEKFFFKGLLLLYNADGLKRIERGSTANAYPADAWISRDELIRRYGGHEARKRSHAGGPSASPAEPRERTAESR